MICIQKHTQDCWTTCQTYVCSTKTFKKKITVVIQKRHTLALSHWKKGFQWPCGTKQQVAVQFLMLFCQSYVDLKFNLIYSCVQCVHNASLKVVWPTWLQFVLNVSWVHLHFTLYFHFVYLIVMQSPKAYFHARCKGVLRLLHSRHMVGGRDL